MKTSCALAAALSLVACANGSSESKMATSTFTPRVNAMPTGSSAVAEPPTPEAATQAVSSKVHGEKKSFTLEDLIGAERAAELRDPRRKGTTVTDKGIVKPGPLDGEDVPQPDDLTPDTQTVASARARAMAPIGLLSFGNQRVRERCTGWLYRADILVTNDHCFEKAPPDSTYSVSFDYYAGVELSSLEWYSCSRLPLPNEFDIAVLRCTGVNGALPGDKYGTLQVSTKEPNANDDLLVVHNNCDTRVKKYCAPVKKMWPAKLMSVKKIKAYEFAHDGTTMRGSSGAPIFLAKTLEMIGMHHESCASENDCDNNESSGQYSAYNLGIRSAQLRAVLSKLP